MNSIQAAFKNCSNKIQGLIFYNCTVYANCIIISLLIKKFCLNAEEENYPTIEKTLYTFRSCSYIFKQELHELYDNSKDNYVWIEFSENKSQSRLLNFILSYKFSNNNLVDDSNVFAEYLQYEVEKGNSDAKRFEESKKAIFSLDHHLAWTLNLHTMGLEMGIEGSLAEQSLLYLDELLIIPCNQLYIKSDSFEFYKNCNSKKVRTLNNLFYKFWNSKYINYILNRKNLFKLLIGDMTEIPLGKFLSLSKLEIGELYLEEDDAPSDIDIIDIGKQLKEIQNDYIIKPDTLITPSSNQKLIEIDFSNILFESITEIRQLEFVKSNLKWSNFLNKLQNLLSITKKNPFFIDCIKNLMSKVPIWKWIYYLFSYYSLKNREYLLLNITNKIKITVYTFENTKTLILYNASDSDVINKCINDFNYSNIEINRQLYSLYYFNNKLRINWYNSFNYELEGSYLKELNKDCQWIKFILDQGCEQTCKLIESKKLTKSKLKQIFTEVIEKELTKKKSNQDLIKYILINKNESSYNYLFYIFDKTFSLKKNKKLTAIEPRFYLDIKDFTKFSYEKKIGYVYYYNKYAEILNPLIKNKNIFNNKVPFNFYDKMTKYFENLRFSNLTTSAKEYWGNLGNNYYFLIYKNKDLYIKQQIENFTHIREKDGSLKIPFYLEDENIFKILKKASSKLARIKKPSSRVCLLNHNSELIIKSQLVEPSALTSMILKKNYKIPSELKLLVQFGDKQTKKTFLETLTDSLLIDLIVETKYPNELEITLEYSEKVLYSTNPLSTEFIVLEQCVKNPKCHWLYIDNIYANLDKVYDYYFILKSFLEDGFLYDIPYETQKKLVLKQKDNNSIYKYNLTLNSVDFYNKIFN